MENNNTDNEDVIDNEPVPTPVEPEEPATGGGKAPEEPEEPAEPTHKSEFWDDFEDEALKEDRNVRKFKSVESLAKSYVGLQRKLGERVSPHPPKGATPDQLAAWRSTKRGGIESEEEYGFVPPGQYNGFDATPMSKSLFEAGADRDLYNKVMSDYYKMEEGRRLSERKNREEGEAALRDEWNEDYEVNMKAVKTFVKQRFPEVYKGLEETDAFRVPVVAKMFKQLNELTSDGEIRIAKATRESYEERLKSIETSPAFRNEWDPGHKAAKAAWMNLISEYSGRGKR